MVDSNQEGKTVAIVGATGAVGLEFLSILDKRKFPLKSLKLLASKRSAGNILQFQNHTLKVEETTEDSFQGVDIALFSAGSSISKKYVNAVKEAGCVMIDNSSAFRMDPETPLVVPEVNPQDALKHKGVIANPNCSTIIMLMAVYPLHQKYPVRRIIVSTYQAASGAGWEAMRELEIGTQKFLNKEDFTPQVMPHPYAFNTFSHNSAIDESGYNEEERKMVNETRKILHNDQIKVSATCVRVPVFRAHSESINIEFENEVPTLEECHRIYEGFPGVKVVDDRVKNHFPMPVEASGRYDCLVGRIRKDISQPDRGLDLFISGDQLLKGAALNAVQIAELLLTR